MARNQCKMRMMMMMMSLSFFSYFFSEKKIHKFKSLGNFQRPLKISLSLSLSSFVWWIFCVICVIIWTEKFIWTGIIFIVNRFFLCIEFRYIWMRKKWTKFKQKKTNNNNNNFYCKIIMNIQLRFWMNSFIHSFIT